jgi:hypothetical protein
VAVVAPLKATMRPAATEWCAPSMAISTFRRAQARALQRGSLTLQCSHGALKPVHCGSCMYCAPASMLRLRSLGAVNTRDCDRQCTAAINSDSCIMCNTCEQLATAHNATGHNHSSGVIQTSM